MRPTSISGSSGRAGDPDRSTVTWTVSRPVVPSTVATGRTDASRATDHDSSVTGRQMPLVAVSGPQSQPKLHAILRIALYGWWLTCGR